jgi:catechol 2,3-dioxygenase-like lactoylglutathione lyase family enzyme
MVAPRFASGLVPDRVMCQTLDDSLRSDKDVTMANPRTRISASVLDSADPRALASFYERLLGWMVVVSEPARPGEQPEDGWVMLRSPEGGAGLSFQYAANYVAPTWPSESGQQQMMVHLDIAVENLDKGVAFAREIGARLSDHQPQDDVRVMLDPAGHPFCLFVGPV